jgi:hypothetical protein
MGFVDVLVEDVQGAVLDRVRGTHDAAEPTAPAP